MLFNAPCVGICICREAILLRQLDVHVLHAAQQVLMVSSRMFGMNLKEISAPRLCYCRCVLEG